MATHQGLSEANGTPRFTWGDSVRVRTGAPVELRVGECGDVVSITEIKTQAQADFYGAPVGKTVYQVEFGDGETVKVPEEWLEADPT